MATRSLTPRATASLSVAPVTCSDRTAPIIFGLEPRVFRAFVLRERIPHVVLGRRLVVRVDVFLAALDRLAAESSDEPAAPAATGGADRLLALVGRTRA